MAVRILREASQAKAVGVDLLVSTIEKNRDRVRTLANMVLSSSSMLVSVALAFLLYLGNNKLLDRASAFLIIIAITLLLVGSIAAIASSLLLIKYVISDEGQFVESLLKLLNSELRVTYVAVAFLLLGAVTAVSAIVRVVLLSGTQ